MGKADCPGKRMIKRSDSLTDSSSGSIDMHEAALTLVLMAKPVRLLWKKKKKMVRFLLFLLKRLRAEIGEDERRSSISATTL